MGYWLTRLEYTGCPQNRRYVVQTQHRTWKEADEFLRAKQAEPVSEYPNKKTNLEASMAYVNIPVEGD